MKKNTKGITLITLVVTIIVLLILAGVSISMLTGQNGILTQAQRAKEETEKAAKVENSALGSLEDYMITDENYNKEKGVNEPRILSGMTKVMFKLPEGNNKGTVIKSGETGFDENSWYDYTSSKWANTVTEDGSYWVWIPRFAYKITYTDASDESKGGTIDVKFLLGTTDEYYTDDTKTKKATAQRANSATEEVDPTTDYYVHPAFTNESSIGYANGGWDKELTGIWVAKFEAGYAGGNNTATVKTSSTSLEYPVFQPTTYSRNYITIGQAFNLSKALTGSENIYGLNSSTTDSHLMKNSEWGATTYLAQSKYGNNNTEPYINNINLNNSVSGKYEVTGVTTGTTNAGTKETTIDNINLVKTSTNNDKSSDGIYIWDQIEGQKSSSTLNMYGVYDMSGGVWERTAGLVANKHKNLNNYGASLMTEIGEKETSTKYVTVYPCDTSVDDSNKLSDTDENLNKASNANYSLNKYIFGDAIRETSGSGTGAKSWKGDYSYFPALFHPFSARGGHLWNSSYAGLFCFYRSTGNSDYSLGFRPVLVAL